MMKKNYSQNINGFTLIELAIVLIVTGLLTVSAVQAYNVYQKDTEGRKTNEALTRVDEALNKYYVVHGRLPCPSDPAKGNEWRGKEWGRDREDGLSTGKVAPPSSDRDKVWADGKNGPVSDAYCKELPLSKDPDNDGSSIGDAYEKCLSDGIASICKLASAGGKNGAGLTENNVWPTPSYDDDSGAQGCGTGQNANSQKVSQTACTATGERKDDSVDTDYNNDADGDGDKTNDFYTEIHPYKDVDGDPQEISCIINNAGCGMGNFIAHDIAAGGDGLDTGGDGVNTGEKTKNLMVLIGGIPFYDLGLPEADTWDGFGNPMRYAVTLGLTSKASYDEKNTGIVLATQNPGEQHSGLNHMEQENAKYVIVSFGKNATDATFYSKQIPGGTGTIVATQPVSSGSPRTLLRCKNSSATGGIYANNGAGGDGYLENENCDMDADFVTSPGKSLNWNGTDTVVRSYFDDTVITDLSSTSSNLWVAQDASVYNTNSGNVGIGESNPTSKLDIGGDFRTLSTLYLKNGRICLDTGNDSNDDGSNDCGGKGINPQDIIEGITCPEDQVFTSITNGGEYYTCTSMVSTLTQMQCPADNHIVGYDSTPPYSGKPVKCLNRNTGNCAWYKSDGTNGQGSC